MSLSTYGDTHPESLTFANHSVSGEHWLRWSKPLQSCHLNCPQIFLTLYSGRAETKLIYTMVSHLSSSLVYLTCDGMSVSSEEHEDLTAKKLQTKPFTTRITSLKPIYTAFFILDMIFFFGGTVGLSTCYLPSVRWHVLLTEISKR